MSKKTATVGDTVLYFPTQQQIDEWTEEQKTVNEKISEPTRRIDLNVPDIGKPLAATVVADWGSDLVNLKVHLDGDMTDRWVTSAQKVSGTWPTMNGYCWCFPKEYAWKQE